MQIRFSSPDRVFGVWPLAMVAAAIVAVAIWFLYRVILDIHAGIPLLPDDGVAAILVTGALQGALLAAVQAVVLRRALPAVPRSLWVVATADGLATGLVVANEGPIGALLRDLSIDFHLAPMVLRGTLGWLVAFAAVGSAQALVMRGTLRLSLALVWILATAGGYTLADGGYALLANLAYDSDVFREAILTSQPRVTGFVLLLSLIGTAVAGMVEGCSLAFLRRAQPAATIPVATADDLRKLMTAAWRAVQQFWEQPVGDTDAYAAPERATVMTGSDNGSLPRQV
jgi:hypothetical protein